MSYPPPPGLKSSSTPQPHPSLPARPPPASSGSFKPAFSSATSTNTGAPGTNGRGFTAFKPRGLGGAQDWQQTASISAGPTAPSHHSAPPTSYNAGSYQQQPYQYQQQNQYYQDPHAYAQPTPPQIQNPFPLPGQGGGGGDGRHDNSNYDPEREAQIAQWQSAYISRDEQTTQRGSNTGVGAASAGGANAIALGSRPTSLSNHEIATVAKTDSGVASVVSGADGKQKTVVRSGGGETWQDPSLLEWDPAHFRLFVGNLAGEVTDDSLLKAFSKYPSVQKARVVRDKRTTKSKGFGFVSFSDGDQYFQAVKDMQGKYIGSHPVLLKRSTTEIKPVTPADRNKKNRMKGRGGGSGNAGAAGHANTGAGVKKPTKTKGGLKILG